MASFFKDMFGRSSREKLRSWLVQINSNGDSVVYRLDENGGIEDMVIGSVAQTILQAWCYTFPNYVVSQIYQPNCPASYGFNAASWAELIEILNGRRHRSRAAETRRIYERAIGADITPLRYFLTPKHRTDYHKIGLTDEARHADTEREARQRAGTTDKIATQPS